MFERMISCLAIFNHNDRLQASDLVIRFGTSASALSSIRHRRPQFGTWKKTNTSLVQVSKLPKRKIQSLCSFDWRARRSDSIWIV